MQKITNFLTFKKDGEKAVKFYTGIFKDSKINSLMSLPDTGQLIHSSFSLAGQQFMAMDGGDSFSFGTGSSLFVTCEDQAEVDYFWEKLSEGGQTGRCGWLTDQFGVSWQIIPTALGRLMSTQDQAQSNRVRSAMLAMDKIDIAGLERAASEQ